MNDVISNLAADNELLKFRIRQLERELAIERGTNRDCFVPIEKICKLVSERTGIPISELRSQRRGNAALSNGRHILMYLACTHAKLSTPRIGRYLNKDHTSVIHGRDKIIARMTMEPDLKALVDELTVRVQNMARDVGIEPTSSGLEAAALPLS